MLTMANTFERGLPMECIVTRIYELLKETNNLIEFEEQLQLLMYDTFANLVGEVFTKINQVIKDQKQEENWKVERNDEKEIQFIFGNVRSCCCRNSKNRVKYRYANCVHPRLDQII